MDLVKVYKVGDVLTLALFTSATRLYNSYQSQGAGQGLVPENSGGGEETENILAEASAIAEQRVTDNFPDVPLGSFSNGSFSNNSRSSIGERSQ